MTCSLQAHILGCLGEAGEVVRAASSSKALWAAAAGPLREVSMEPQTGLVCCCSVHSSRFEYLQPPCIDPPPEHRDVLNVLDATCRSIHSCCAVPHQTCSPSCCCRSSSASLAYSSCMWLTAAGSGTAHTAWQHGQLPSPTCRQLPPASHCWLCCLAPVVHSNS